MGGYVKRFSLILFITFLSFSSFSQWIKEGTASGNINDLKKGQNSSYVYLGIDGGFISYLPSSEAFSDNSLNLPSGSILKFDELFDSSNNRRYFAVLSENGVYVRNSSMSKFLWANPRGIIDSSENPTDYLNLKGIAITKDSTNKYAIYLGMKDYGIFKKLFCNNINNWCPEILFYDDAEDDSPWEITGIFHRDRCRKVSGNYSFKAGANDYPTCTAYYPAYSSGTLTLGTQINLGSSGHGYYLKFWEYYDTNTNDYCTVQISTDNGSTWQTIDSYYGDGKKWQQKSYSLEAFSGYIKIRFTFGDSFLSGTGEGWYIDDIEITRESVWERLNPQIPNLDITDLYYYNASAGNKLFVTTAGGIYRYDSNSWTLVSPGYKFLSIDGPPYNTNGYIIAGSEGYGVYSTSNPLSIFTSWCGTTPPPSGNFVSVSVDSINPLEGPFSAITENKFYKLKPSCSPAYEEYRADFEQKGLSVLSDCNNPTRPSFYVGTKGLGLFKLNCNDYQEEKLPMGNEGDINPSYIPNKNVTKISISKDLEPVFFASSLSDGLFKSLYKYNGKDYYVRYFFDSSIKGIQRGTAIAISPLYDESASVSTKKLYVFLGTDGKGIFRSVDGGGTWTKYSFGYKVVDMAISPNFLSDNKVYLLTENGQVYYTTNNGSSWVEDTSFPSTPKKGYDIEISPNFASDNTIFVATSLGLYKYSTNGWQLKFSRYPVLSVTLAPLYHNISGSDLESSTVIIGTRDGGIWHSFNKGEEGWTQVPNYTNSTVPLIKLHPEGDAYSISGEDLYSIFLINELNSTNNGVYSLKYLSTGWSISKISNMYRISDIAFHPYFKRTGEIREVYLGTSNDKIYIGSYPTFSWEKALGFNSTPPYVFSVLEDPDFTGIKLAGTKGYGPIISFNKGLSYYPFGSLRYNNYVLHTVPSVAITNNVSTHKVLMASSDDEIQGPYGIYYLTYPVTNPYWYRAYLCLPPNDCSSPPTNYSQTNFNGDLIKEIRYTNLGTDIEASDFNLGPIISDPNMGGNYGVYWQVDSPSPNMPENICDITYPISLSPGRGTKSAFIWGVSGLSHGFRSTVAGAYKWTLTEGWSIRNGSGSFSLPSADWRAVYSLSENEVIVGARDGYGVFKTEDGGLKWINASEGLDSTSFKVNAFTSFGSYIFAAIEESSEGLEDGGVYMSDCQGRGYAWVPFSDGLFCTSNYDLSMGSVITTGSTCDGIYHRENIYYTGTPTSYFIHKRENPWNEREVHFYDKSAGLCTSNCITCPNAQWDWSCNDGFFSNFQNPTHIFSNSGSFYCYLNINNGYYSDSFDTSIYIPEILTLKIQKNGDLPRLYWERISGDESLVYKYKVYRSTDPQGSSISNLITITPADPLYCNSTHCWFTDTEATGSVYYYRIFTQD